MQVDAPGRSPSDAQFDQSGDQPVTDLEASKPDLPDVADVDWGCSLMPSSVDRRAPNLEWPTGFDRTDPDDREPYPGDLSPTRKESFQSIGEELERWGATQVEISTASTHYADRPNIPHQHDKPAEVGVAAYYRREGEPADKRYALACDRWATQRENARAIALYARRMRLAEKCGVATAQSTHATARLPPGDGQAATSADDVIATEPAEPELSDEEAADVLGVTVDAPDRVVRTAYEEAVKREHPDQGGNGDLDRLQRARDQLLEASEPDKGGDGA